MTVRQLLGFGVQDAVVDLTARQHECVRVCVGGVGAHVMFVNEHSHDIVMRL